MVDKTYQLLHLIDEARSSVTTGRLRLGVKVVQYPQRELYTTLREYTL